MPMYDYECQKCGETFTECETAEEHQHRRSPKCPQCGSRRTRQLVPVACVHTSKKS